VILIATGVLIASFIAVGGIFCAATLHVPRRTGTKPEAAAIVNLSATDGAQLSAWWFRSPIPTHRCVLILHGIADSRVGSAGFAPLFLTAGYNVLTPDSRGHGTSGGEYVTYGLLEKHDVIAWAEWMKRAGCVRTFALGESLGATILIQAAAIRPEFSAIVAECPFADLRDIARYRVEHSIGSAPGAAVIAALVVESGFAYARWIDGLDFGEVSPVEAMARIRTPVLLIHGLSDSQTPPSHSQRLARANPASVLWLVPNAGHTGAAAAAPQQFRTRVLDWFAQER